MTDMDAACLIQELKEYNRAGQMRTPQMDGPDTIFGCALDHAVRALVERAGMKLPNVRFDKNPNGSFSAYVKGC